MPGDAGKEVAIAESVMRVDNKRNTEVASFLPCMSGFGDKIFGEVLGDSKGEKIAGVCIRLFVTDSCTFCPLSFS